MKDWDSLQYLHWIFYDLTSVHLPGPSVTLDSGHGGTVDDSYNDLDMDCGVTRFVKKVDVDFYD